MTAHRAPRAESAPDEDASGLAEALSCTVSGETAGQGAVGAA